MGLITAESNQRIFDKVSEIVKGHEFAKKVLITIINRSKIRYYRKWGLQEDVSDLKPINCLLIGETGTGKTYLVDTLAKIMKFPVVKVDATELTQTSAGDGIKKKDLIKRIQRAACEYKKDEPERYLSTDGVMDQMVIFVDEVDKLGEGSNSDWHFKVQSNFLTLFDHKEDAQGLTFIFAGAFSGLNIRNLSSKSIGFQQLETKSQQAELTSKIIKFGLIPELVGRFNHIVLLDELTEVHYREILFSTLLPKMQEQLQQLGIHNFLLSKTEGDAIINEAMKSGLGIRALETELLKRTVELEFAPPSTLFLLP